MTLVYYNPRYKVLRDHAGFLVSTVAVVVIAVLVVMFVAVFDMQSWPSCSKAMHRICPGLA